ncbi:MAG: sigma-70 family RNA polymerase sigma factor [Pseudomonadota bacterium]|nr:sigma-70 family RNA polymerase sigma factor [Pseudomonadota bacterium]
MLQSGQEDLAALVGRVARGDKAGFSELYRRTAPKLNGIVSRILYQEQAAAEALQETYVRIWQNASAFDPAAGSAITWMATIARNQAIDLQRRSAERISRRSIGDDVLLEMPADSAAEGESGLAYVRLRRCLDKLPADRRVLVMLAYCQGYTREELAEHAKRPVATIKSMLRRSLMTLKECIDDGA